MWAVTGRRVGLPVRVAAFVVLVLAIWLPRSLALDRFAIFDEYLWLSRSANFYCALSQRDYANTFQREHPGVTTMWAGTLGFMWRAPDYVAGCEQVGKRENEATLRERGYEPAALLAAGRFYLVLGSTLALALSYLYAQRLFGFLPATVGFALIAFDPFHLAHVRLLHVDGTLSSTMALSLLAFLSYQRERRPVALVVSAIAAGLAFLTKSSALFLVPFVGLLSLIRAWSDRRRATLSRLAWRTAWHLATWGLVAGAVFVALWPAMWVDPAGTLEKVIDLAQDYSTRGHPNPLYFNGQLYLDGRLDASFYDFYPITFLWRTTPVTLLGLLAATVAYLVRRDSLNEAEGRHAVFGLTLFAALLAFALNLSAKKFDRYLLPAYAPLDLVAGVGWVAAVRWLLAWRRGRTPPHPHALRSLFSLLIVIAVGVQAWMALPTSPYYLSYYNPLLGGGRRASRVLLIGWGEGLDQAARYLNRKPNVEELYVMSWYFPGCFSYFFTGLSRDLPYQGWRDIHFQEALNADYAVVYHTHQQQRYAPAQLLDYLAHQAHEHAIWLNGLEYVRVYKMVDDVHADPTYVRVDAALGKRVALEGYRLSEHRLVPGESIVVDLSWRVVAAPGEKLKVFVQVLNRDGMLVAQHDGEPVAWRSPTERWAAGEQVVDRHGVTLPADLPPGAYTLIVGMYRASGERLVVTQGGEAVGDALALGQVTVHPPEANAQRGLTARAD
jgi:4-amino-4-deoxy-L-arabinose transferase-like glycosyltransferase